MSRGLHSFHFPDNSRDHYSGDDTYGPMRVNQPWDQPGCTEGDTTLSPTERADLLERERVVREYPSVDSQLTALRARNEALEKVVEEVRVFVSVRRNWASLGAVIAALDKV
jgi:hypothetical protein